MREHSKRSTPEKAIIPLSAEQRANYKTIIYQHESALSSDKVLVAATTTAMQEAGFKIIVDVDSNKPQSDHVAVIRSATEERMAKSAESALFLGVAEATRKKLLKNQHAETPGYQETALKIAREMVQSVVSKPQLLDSFAKYYGSLRWSSDQEQFTRELFIHGTDFNPSFIEENVRGRDLELLMHTLEINTSYQQTREWKFIPTEKILEKHPEIDYKRLQNESFRQSNEGQSLLQAYTHLQGEILARRYKSSETVITPSGKVLAEPIIPLSKHPVIEALIIDEMSLDKPKPKYSFGPSELTNIILDSDSQLAHQALVDSIITRLPIDQRRVFDGPDEFQFKHGQVIKLIREYRSAKNPERKSLLKESLLKVAEAYTGNGTIATSVREEYQQRLAQGDKETYARSEINQVNNILTDILTAAFAAPDPEVTGLAQNIVLEFLPDRKGMVTVNNDPLTLNKEQLGLALIDSLEHINKDSIPQLFKTLGTHIFNNEAVGTQLKEFAQTKIRINTEMNNPDVLRAFNERKEHSLFSFGNEKSDEYIAAEQRYENLTLTANELSESLKRSKLDFLLSKAEELVDIQRHRKLTDSENIMFTGLINRTKLGNYQMRTLPSEYYRMMEMAKSGNLTERQQSTITWQVYESFKYLDEEAAHLMVSVVLDIYEAALGPAHNVGFPNNGTSHTLSAASHIVGEHGKKIFETANQKDLQTLVNYANQIREYAEIISNQQSLPDNIFTTDEQKETTRNDEWREDALHNLTSIARELQIIDKYYGEFLLIEAVKVQPSEYYPWLLSKLTPFWQKMQWEVGPGNRPSKKIMELYQTIENYVENHFIIQEKYPENFDVTKDGNLDTFLNEMYQQMIVPNDIKYNGTVWKEGLTFMHYAVAFMPEIVMKQIQEKYPNSNFSKYIKDERDRWNNPKADGIV